MKKLILSLLVILTTNATNMMAQDDMYFTPKKLSAEEKAQKKAEKEARKQAEALAEQRAYEEAMARVYRMIYHDDVDLYNRHYGYQPGDSLVFDSLNTSDDRFVWEENGDSLYNVKENYKFTRMMERFKELDDALTFGIYRPWYYNTWFDPWYDYWYDPWYYGYGYRYGFHHGFYPYSSHYIWNYGYYDPWFYGYTGWYGSYRPWYYDTFYPGGYYPHGGGAHHGGITYISRTGSRNHGSWNNRPTGTSSGIRTSGNTRGWNNGSRSNSNYNVPRVSTSPQVNNTPSYTPSRSSGSFSGGGGGGFSGGGGGHSGGSVRSTGGRH